MANPRDVFRIARQVEGELLAKGVPPAVARRVIREAVAEARRPRPIVFLCDADGTPVRLPCPDGALYIRIGGANSLLRPEECDSEEMRAAVVEILATYGSGVVIGFDDGTMDEP